MTLYTPAFFAEPDNRRVASLIDHYGFATLIAPESLHISHVPLMLDRKRGARGTLVGHLARANPHAEALQDEAMATALFHGPHDYVSPTWYEAPGVPTWNYAAVHAHGTVWRIDDAEAKWDIVTRLSAQYEVGSAKPWNPEANKAQWLKLLDAIVGFEIEITAIEAKFKLSQNRITKDQENVIAHFEANAQPDGRAMAALMRENLETKRSRELLPK
jgi:transcriptional regulator